MLATVLIIVIGKSIAAFVIVRLFGHPTATALTIAASLAQIGEFSFILAGLGVGLKLLPEAARDLILAGAILSILLNPVFFAALDRWLAKAEAKSTTDAVSDLHGETAAREPVPLTRLTDHVVLVGHGRVGSFISAALPADTALLVIEDDADQVATLSGKGAEAIAGNAADPEVMRGGESPRRALPAGRDPRCVRGRPGGGAGSRAQSRAPHRRARPFRGRDRAPQASTAPPRW